MTYQAWFKTFRETLGDLMAKSEVDSIFFLTIEHFTGMGRTDFYLSEQQVAEPDVSNSLNHVLQKLKLQEPIQYILNEAWFMEHKYYVNPHVLIPRSETEELVQYILKNRPGAGKVLDIGTGSGCIAIELEQALSANVWAIDYSEDVLKVARKNAKSRNSRVQFVQDDILSPTTRFGFGFDVIVSNPPYILESEKAEMKQNVLNFEPGDALFVHDNNPLVFYEAIRNFSTHNIEQNGLLMVEINEYLSKATKALFEKSFEKVEIIKDIHNKDRFITATNE